jgi:hypothetical protein
MRHRKLPNTGRAQPEDFDRLQAPSIEEQLKSAMPLVTAPLRVRIARTIAQLREDSLLAKQSEEVAHA